jgi:hypothetical protein
VPVVCCSRSRQSDRQVNLALRLLSSDGQLVEAAWLSHGTPNTAWEDTLFEGAFGEMQVNGVTDQYLRTEMLMPVKKLFPWSPGFVHSTVLIRTGETSYSDSLLLSIPPDTSAYDWGLYFDALKSDLSGWSTETGVRFEARF